MSPQHEAFTRCRQFAGNRVRELAWAGMFALVLGMSQAQAISLGQIRVESHLGQPLDAVVYVTAAPGEVLTASCFSAAPAEASELPGLANVKLSLSRKVSPMALRLKTRDPVREPLSQVVLRVRCPGVPSITRSFWVMVDPQGIADYRGDGQAARSGSTDTAAAPVRSNDSPVRSRTAVASGGERVRVYAAYAGPTEPITPGETYIVRNGDVLSMIASRVSGRASNTVWELADKIFRLNPAAFMSGDPDMLIAGSQIYVPLPSVPMPLPASPAQQVASAAPATVAGMNRGVSVPPPAAAAGNNNALATGTPATPLPVMVLSRSLSSLSVSRIAQRRSGVLQLPAAPANSGGLQGTAPALGTTTGQNAPETPQEQSSPDVAVTPPKLAVAPATGQQGGSLGWAAFIGLLLLVVIGLPLAMLLYRRSVTRSFRDDLRKALRRRRYADELVRARQMHEPTDSGYSVTESEAEPEVSDGEPAEPQAQANPETTPGESTALRELPAAGPSAMLADLLDSELTVKVKSPEESLDLEFPEMTHEVAVPVATDDSDLTLEIETPNGAPELDLELPDLFSTTAASDEPPSQATATSSGFDGMEELDFDPELLALDYSKEYEASRKSETAGGEVSGRPIDEPTDDKPAERGDGSENAEYYHLEAQVDAAGEDGGDELSFDDDDDENDDDDAKVVQFPQQQSGQ